MTDEKKGAKKKDPSELRDLLWVSTLGINLVVATGAGVVIGHYLDKWLHTQPVLTILFFLIGTFAGFRQIYVEIQKLGREDESKDERKH
jgi:ATP synthase protein I